MTPPIVKSDRDTESQPTAPRESPYESKNSAVGISVGQYAININRETLDVVDRGHQYRPAIFKKTGAAVPADTFLDPRFSPISAIWAMDFDEGLVLGRQQPMAIVHNPAALNPLPEKLLPSFSEYKALIKGELLEVTRNSGSLL